jgi:hypothetical protein
MSMLVSQNEVLNHSSSIKGLALSVVMVSQFAMPLLSQFFEIILTDGDHFPIHKPIHNITAGRSSQRTLIVIESMLVILLFLFFGIFFGLC